MAKIRAYKPGKYGKGLIQSEADPEAMIWRVKGWNGDPHHAEISDVLQVKRPNVAFHIDKRRRFYFHSEDPGFVHPHNPPKLAAHIHRQYPQLTWGKISAEAYEQRRGIREGKRQLAMAKRPLRPFEQGAHLHVLDWAHTTARYRFQAAGATQVKAAAKAWAASDSYLNTTPPELPSLAAAITAELGKLYALGHATVRSEIDHQRNGRHLPIGLSAAPAPPNLRLAKAKKGRFPHCASCQMFDAGTCWGYGNYPVKPNQLCDSYERDPQVRTLALAENRRDPGSLRARARLVAQHVAHQIWQAVHRARLQGISDQRRLRELGQSAGSSALAQAASQHAGGAINAGRLAAAISTRNADGKAQIIGARYTSVLDKNTCGPCAAADTGDLVPLGSPEWVPTPNPACLGGDRCRCIHVYQLATEETRLPIAAGR